VTLDSFDIVLKVEVPEPPRLVAHVIVSVLEAERVDEISFGIEPCTFDGLLIYEIFKFIFAFELRKDKVEG